MNPWRIVAVLACGLGAALGAGAADRTGPAPSELIYPRGSDAGGATATAGGTPAAAGNPAVFAPGPLPAAGGLLPTLGYLVAFGGLIGGGWLLLKRGGLGRRFGKDEGRLRVLETKMLGNRQFLVVVEYEDAKMLVGVCPGRIDYLTPLAGHPLATGASAITAGEDDESPALTFPGAEVRR
jgi:flagellar protein FliO/FliZ